MIKQLISFDLLIALIIAVDFLIIKKISFGKTPLSHDELFF